MINEKDKKIEALTEQLNWYSQQIKLQQKKLFGSSSEKTVLPDQISLFDEIELESTPIKQCTTFWAAFIVNIMNDLLYWQ